MTDSMVVSKYDHALKMRNRNNQLIAQLDHQRCDGQRDKTGLHWVFIKRGDRSLSFQTDCYHGYYGRSSVSSDNSDDLGKEIATTLDDLKSVIIARTIERLEKQIVDAAKAAKEEAEQILKDMSDGLSTSTR